MKLSERIRPNVEAAPWVAEEVLLMENEITTLREQVEKLTKERDEAVAAMTPRELPKSAVPHAYMLEETARYATYWESGARTEPDRGLALICLHQAVNGWKNAAYSMAEKRMRAEHQLAALASQNEKLRDALENHSGNYKLTRAECAAINAILSLPDLATPALNRIRAEGMRMAAEILAVETSFDVIAKGLFAKADELEAGVK